MSLGPQVPGCRGRRLQFESCYRICASFEVHHECFGPNSQACCQKKMGGLGYLVSTNLPNTNTNLDLNLTGNNVDMLCASRHKVFRFIATSQAVFARTPNCQSRTVRTKGGTGFYADAIRRDERLLKVFRFTTLVA